MNCSPAWVAWLGSRLVPKPGTVHTRIGLDDARLKCYAFKEIDTDVDLDRS
jgi:hypothetical protein